MRIKRILPLLVCLLLCFQYGLAKRVALVIGNPDYVNATTLPNTRNDAVDMTTVLEELDFKVTQLINVGTKEEFIDEVIAFRQKLSSDDIAFFYYSGHGAQIDNVNYLVPTKSLLKSRSLLKQESVSVNYILDEIQSSGSSINVLVLDACRNLPKLSGDSREITRGLAEMPRTAGSLIAFSTRAGDVALDGIAGEKNSPYVSQLKNLLLDSERDLADVFLEVQYQVADATGRKQVPQTLIDLDERIYLANNLITNTTKTSFDSTPSGADIYLSGKLLGQTSLTTEIKIGEYQLELKKEGFEVYSEPITIERTRDIGVVDVSNSYNIELVATPTITEATEVQNNLELGISFATESEDSFLLIIPTENTDSFLSILSTEDNVNVYVDGTKVATTPLNEPLLLKGGAYEVVLKKEGFEDYTKQVELQSGSSHSFFAVLEATENVTNFSSNIQSSDLIEFQNFQFNQNINRYTPAAERGDAEAQHKLGEEFRDSDSETAVYWYKLAAEQGYAPAQDNLGVMYENGWGVEQNYETAVYWYKLAAEQGYISAQFNLENLQNKSR